jgi:hypothetical protein
MNKIFLAVLPLLFCLGCTTGKHYVIASTATVIGLEIAQNPSSQMYQGKLGYNRAELALVPSNRASGKEGDTSVGAGAADTTDVMMELHYANIFSLQSSGIYQRLAVGKNAVSQPGAALMFAKGKDGQLDPRVAESITMSNPVIPEAAPGINKAKGELTDAYLRDKATQQIKYDKAAQAAGYRSFNAFLLDTSTTQAQLDKVKSGLQ